MSQPVLDRTVVEDDLVPSGSVRRRRLATATTLIANSAVIVGFFAMVVFFGVSRPDTFLTSATLQDLLNQAVIPVILACGITITMSVGEFDLSFTSIVGLSAALVMVLMANEGQPIAISIGVAIVAGVLAGAAVGLLVTFGSASSFIVTLAIGSVLAGLEIMLTDNTNIYTNVPTGFTAIASNEFLGFKLPVWIGLTVVVVSATLLHGTTFGRHAYAIGSNAKAAFVAGVRVRRIRILSFVVLGMLAGLGAIMATAKASSYYPNISGGLLLSTYAAVFLGAAMSKGNRFTIGGSTLGVLWLLTLQTGLTQLNQPTWVSTLVQGAVLLTAVLIAARNRGGRLA